ncbi:PepSY-associated TM helix domain-containing protein [Aquimarina pacifica]|uniref:PepSY-associated TM helix domain-containing protein n=1 Tax=Aquimarina pacifica TaxID=1296415 RepID=UPI0004723A13|nr:PepSY domain-containing protein [Aquimarina pacifica]
MKKNEKLNKWLWKWHFISGIISLPFILILSITGIIYLFKADYDAPRQKHIKEVVVTGTPLTLQKQWEIVKKEAKKQPTAMIMPTATNRATEFVSGRFSHKKSTYINPYTGTISGTISPKDSAMFTVRKLHGELLMGTFGTKIIEAIASWMVVLILTGLYVWWPGKGWSIKGFFIPRIKNGKRTFYRDLHAITGFWFSILLLMILAGGFPWTDVFGSNFKTLQKITNTGFPSSWSGRQVNSTSDSNIKKTITLDRMVTIAKELNLPGEVTVQFPKGEKGIYSVSNSIPSNLNEQKKVHFDQYTGQKILGNNWKDVGILMRGRMWFMAFHQGEFGVWNWVLMLITATALAIMSIAAIVSYNMRKKRRRWGVPKVPASFKAGYGIIILIILLSILFPLFGLSLLFILGIEYYQKRIDRKNQLRNA